mmetsp:Transcript_80447/g.151949  ORF Transcript_80447/g.151949 Transcript_80447/m.151949 type:complete len:134 (-) Transcript_80447:248-649(-)
MLRSSPRLDRRDLSDFGDAGAGECDCGGEEGDGDGENDSVEVELARFFALLKGRGFSTFLLAFVGLPPSPAELASPSEACSVVSGTRAAPRAFLFRRRLRMDRRGGKGSSGGPLVRTRGRWDSILEHCTAVLL